MGTGGKITAPILPRVFDQVQTPQVQRRLADDENPAGDLLSRSRPPLVMRSAAYEFAIVDRLLTLHGITIILVLSAKLPLAIAAPI